MYKNTLKLVTSGILTGLILSLAVACDKTENTGKGNKLELWTMQLKPTFNDYMNDMIKSYKKDNPDVDIDWVDLPSKEIEQKTLTSIASGKAPDVVNLNPDFTAKLAEEGALSDIETLVTPDIKNTYLPNIWKASTFGNKTYGFPWYLSTAITIYNKEIFKTAGLPDDKPPKTFRDLDRMGETIKKKTGKYIYMPNFADSGKILEFMVQRGVSLLSNDHSKAAFNTPEAVQFLSYWINLAKKEVIPRDSVTQGHREAIDKFQAGETAILVSGPQFLNIIKQNAPQLYAKIGVARQLTGASGKVGVGVMNLVIPESSKNKQGAVKLAEFITNSQNQLAFSKLVTILPSVSEAGKDPYFTTIPANAALEDKARKISAEQLKDADVLLPTVEKWAELSKIFDQYFQQAFLGQIKPKEALEKAETDWNKILLETKNQKGTP
jgi:putative chitobiose transport system substrate-binding protein